MTVADNRLAALRDYHARRIADTRVKLMEALDRMEAGNTVVLARGAKPTKTNLCREAGVNIHTLLKKIGKTKRRRYEDVLERLAALAAEKNGGDDDDERDRKIQELRDVVKELEADKANMALEINNLGLELLAAREEIERLRSIEEQNADLREEIRRMQEPAKLRLIGNGKGGKNGRAAKHEQSRS